MLKVTVLFLNTAEKNRSVNDWFAD